MATLVHSSCFLEPTEPAKTCQQPSVSLCCGTGKAGAAAVGCKIVRSLARGQAPPGRRPKPLSSQPSPSCGHSGWCPTYATPTHGMFMSPRAAATPPSFEWAAGIQDAWGAVLARNHSRRGYRQIRGIRGLARRMHLPQLRTSPSTPSLPHQATCPNPPPTP
eukprot:108613-Chlamydomonas_euryale.AAC.2